MHGTSWIQSSVLAMVLGAALAAPTGAATPDAWITTKTKLALLTTEGVSGMAINVDTVGGQITLHGTVRSAAEQTKAETVAQQVDGVQGVCNLLQVVAAQDEGAMELSDDALTKRLTQALQVDPALLDSHMAVQSVHQGVVLLGGTATTLSAHLHAVAVVASVPGVRQVASEVQSPNTLDDAEIWREPMPHQTSTAYGMEEAASDMWITSATKMRLLADSQTPALAIHVDTWRGIVTLFGMVPSEAAKAAAKAAAFTVSGVQSVVNDLQVVESALQPAMQVHDEELARVVKKVFATPTFKDITVDVENGVVRLTGTVSTGAQRLEAAVIARSIQGVRSVQDDLHLATATN
jgi:hyperosmotically inducible periplasmic protein